MAVGLVNPAAYCFSANPFGKTVCAKATWIELLKHVTLKMTVGGTSRPNHFMILGRENLNGM
jgi:hypothetical protein